MVFVSSFVILLSRNRFIMYIYAWDISIIYNDATAAPRAGLDDDLSRR